MADPEEGDSEVEGSHMRRSTDREINSPKEVEDKIARSLLRIAVVVIVVLTLVLIAAASVMVVVLLNQRHLLASQGRLIRMGEQTAVEHRVRNEAIHACVVEKQDVLRADIASLLQTPPGAKPNFPSSDGITCPAINPVTGKDIPPPSPIPPTTASSGATPSGPGG